jgi:hypothetical protein
MDAVFRPSSWNGDNVPYMILLVVALVLALLVTCVVA